MGKQEGWQPAKLQEENPGSDGNRFCKKASWAVNRCIACSKPSWEGGGEEEQGAPVSRKPRGCGSGWSDKFHSSSDAATWALVLDKSGRQRCQVLLGSAS